MDPITDCSSSWKSIKLLRTSCKMLMLCPYGFRYKCSSSLETHHPAADVLQNVGSVSILVPPYVLFLVWEPFILLWTCHKMLASISLMCSRPFLSAHVDGALAKGSQTCGVEMPPRVVELWISFRDAFHTSAFCSHGESISSRRVPIRAFRLIDVKVSESYGSICFCGTSSTAHCGYVKIFTEG